MSWVVAFWCGMGRDLDHLIPLPVRSYSLTWLGVTDTIPSSHSIFVRQRKQWARARSLSMSGLCASPAVANQCV